MSLSWPWLLVSLTMGLLFVYPYFIYPRVLSRLKPAMPLKRSSGADLLAESRVALLFCAYNEASSLPAKITNLRAIKERFPAIQIWAYSDGSTDATDALLSAVPELVNLVSDQRRLGKVRGMHKLVCASDAEILVFTDANVVIDPDDIDRLLSYFNDPTVGAVACTLQYLTRDAGSVTTTAAVNGFYWRLEERLKQLETRTGSMMGADGACFARRRDGYPVLQPDHVDDLGASFTVLFQGQRCVSAPDVHAFEGLVESSGDEFRRKRRIACGSYSTYRFLRKRFSELSLLDRYKFVSHKVLRWWGFLILSLGFLAFLVGIGNVFAAIAVVLALVFLAMLGALGIRPFASVYEILKATLATNVGVIESIVGKQYATWDPAGSRDVNMDLGKL